jgi:hypothetical protein
MEHVLWYISIKEAIMVISNENFMVDKAGQKIGVFLDMKTYQRMVEDLEGLEDIRAFDEAKAAKDQSILFEETTRQIERKRS